MSNLSKALRSERVGRLNDVLHWHNRVLADGRSYTQYQISATFHSHVAVSCELDIGESKHLTQAKRNITEAVFGEFRDPMIQMMNYISTNQPDKALEVANQIYETMFNE